MAAVSPVVINSSPRSFGMPSVTPPSCRASSHRVNSSSSPLPSPSCLFKRHVPSGARTGAATAVRSQETNHWRDGIADLIEKAQYEGVRENERMKSEITKLSSASGEKLVSHRGTRSTFELDENLAPGRDEVDYVELPRHGGRGLLYAPDDIRLYDSQVGQDAGLVITQYKSDTYLEDIEGLEANQNAVSHLKRIEPPSLPGGSSGKGERESKRSESIRGLSKLSSSKQTTHCGTDYLDIDDVDSRCKTISVPEDSFGLNSRSAISSHASTDVSIYGLPNECGQTVPGTDLLGKNSIGDRAKKRSQPDAGGGKRKCRKRQPKSEPIVLNSDDTDHRPFLPDGDLDVVPEMDSISCLASRKLVKKLKSNTNGKFQNREPTPDSRQGETEMAISLSEEADIAHQSMYFSLPDAKLSGSAATASKRLSHETALTSAQITCQKLLYVSEDAEFPTEADCAIIDMAPITIHSHTKNDGALEEATAALAGGRRRNWTPVEDTPATNILDSRPSTAISCSSTQAQSTDILKVLDSFHFVPADETSKDSTHSTTYDGPSTKRRRIEPAELRTGRRSSAKPRSKEPAKTNKRIKSPKKKAQTITALATAAYQSTTNMKSELHEKAESLVSHPIEVDDIQPTTAEKLPVAQVKTKPSRKSRAKKNDSQTGTSKQGKGRKKEINESTTAPKLYSPTRARGEMHRQDFLFGTFSQLLIDESPTYIRDMQVAAHESDELVSSQALISPQQQSRIKVPTAPHGNCLSVEQANRDLWCAASRDCRGGTLSDTRQAQVDPGDSVTGNAATEPAPLAMARALKPPENIQEHSRLRVDGRPTIEDSDESMVVASRGYELSRHKTSDSNPNVQAQPLTSSSGAVSGYVTSHADTTIPGPLIQTNADMDTSASVLEPTFVKSPPLSRVAEQNKLVPGPMATPLRSSTRVALQTLDANMSVLPRQTSAKDLASSHIRLSSTAARRQERNIDQVANEPPPKLTAAETAIPPMSSPKRRGRPPKRQKVAPSASSPSRPRKTLDVAFPNPSISREPGWTTIEEIDDSDSPKTPSPQRRSSLSPHGPQPLVLSPVASPLPAAPSSVSTAPAFKPGDSQWPAMLRALFPQITSMVKSAPCSVNASEPSWWQKILLYDPIILEDLTDWLDAQGLRVEVRRAKPKPKPKKRGRKKLGTVGEEVEEWEVRQEELQVWMVQKWCEQNSICCGWRDGLRGGFRKRS